MKSRFLLLLVVLMVAMNGCKAQNEKNIVYDENASVRKIKGFTSIKLSGAIDLYLSQGNEEAVAVSAASKEAEAQIKTVVKNGVLEIYPESNGISWKSWGDTKMKAYVTFKSIDNLEASGACNIKVSQTIKGSDLSISMSGASDFAGAVSVSNLKIEASGASNYKISGAADNVKIDASGACGIKGYNLKAQTCKVEASGASSIRISVEKELRAEASGGSSITYKGNAIVKENDASGGSSIKRKTDDD